MDRNKEIFEESKKYMPGGVNSPVSIFWKCWNKSSSNKKW